MFVRVLNCVINGIPIGGLRIDFDVTQTKQTTKKEPDVGVIKIYNLTPATRSLINKIGSYVVLNAGHLDSLPAPIFSGVLKDYREEPASLETVSVFEVEDRGGVFGANSLYSMKMSLSFPMGTLASAIIAAISGYSATPLSNIIPGDYVYLSGFSYVGILKNALDKVVHDALDLEWYVNDGRLYVHNPSLPQIGLPAVITPLSGMIGSPEKIVEEEDNGKAKIKVTKYKVKTLLNPRLFVGQTVNVSSKKEVMSGVFKIETVHKYGSNYSNDFYSEITARALT